MARFLLALSLCLIGAGSARAQGPTFSLEVTAPPAIQGLYSLSTGYEPSLVDVGPVSGGVVLVDDGTGVGTDACEALTPASAAAVAGAIALVDRGACTFVTKTRNAEDAGAIAVIVANNVGGDELPFLGSGDFGFTIPTVGITQNDGALFEAHLTGLTVTLDGEPPVLVTGPAPCVGGVAEIFPCDGVDLMHHLPLSTFVSPGTDAPLAGNDIWGWTDPAPDANGVHREYALVGLTNGTAFVDVTVPDAPVYLGTLPTATSGSPWRDVKVFANHAFIVAEASGHGMQIFDLTRLRSVASPPETFAADARYTGAGKAHNVVIDESRALAFLVGANEAGYACNGGGLHIVNLAVPTTPTPIGCFDADGYTHDAQCLPYDGPDPDYAGRAVCFALNEDTVTIVDVTNPTAPSQIARVVYPSPSYTHQGWLTADQRYLIVNDETDGDNVTPTRTLVMDVTDLDTPDFAFAFDGPTSATDHNVYVRGQHAFQSHYAAGLRILDAAAIASGTLAEVAHFDTYPDDDVHGFKGQWSNYPYFESGVVIVNDMQGGLFVLRPELLRPARATVTGGAGWRLLAAPASGLAVDDLAALNLVQGVPGFYPSAATNLFTGYDGSAFTVTGAGAPLAPGRGLFWYFYDNDLDPGGPSQSFALPTTLATTAPLVTTDTDVALSDAGDGSNLLGNPFGTSLDVSDVASWPGAGALASTVVQVYDAAAGGYVTSATEPVISTWQGFWAEAAAAGTLTIPAGARTTGGTLAKRAGTPTLAFELSTADGARRDRAAVVRFSDDASDGADVFDAAKRGPAAATFVTLAPEGDADGETVLRAVETRATPTAPVGVPMHARAVGTSGDMVLSWSTLDLPEDWSAELRDLVTGATVDVLAAHTYAFTVTPEAARTATKLPSGGAMRKTSAARFDLVVGPGSVVASGADGAAELALSVPFPNPTRETARVPFSLAKAGAVRLSVIDALGREVAVLVEGDLSEGEHAATLVTRRFASGMYVIRLAAGGQVMTQRVTVVP